METQIVPATDRSIFLDPASFEFAQRVANVFAKSTMVPEHFKNNIGNCMIALNYAARIKADPFMVLQNLFVIHGKPGIEGKLVIALVNQSGRFEPLEFEEDEDGCFSFAKEKKSGKVLKGPKITWAMVKGEGWLSKNGSKWEHLSQLMFRYRAATYFARTYCPEVLLGMQTKEELEDIINLQPASNGKTWEPEPPAPNPDFDYDAYRKGLVNDGFAESDIDAFEAKLAAHYKKPIEGIRQQIGDNPKSFFASLTKWVQANGTPHPPVQAAEEQEPEPENPSSGEQYPPLETDEGPKDPIRDEFIGLKSAGYSTWVHKNKARIPTFTSEIQAEIRQKWLKMYPNATFPLDKKQDEESPKTNGNGNGATVFCPENQSRKCVKVCEECDKAEKCQTYQEWVFENKE